MNAYKRMINAIARRVYKNIIKRRAEDKPGNGLAAFLRKQGWSEEQISELPTTTNIEQANALIEKIRNGVK